MGLPRRFRARVSASCVGVLAGVLAASGPAAAAPKPIAGKLSKPGYTVIALAPNGQASVRARRGKFRLRPPSARVTLHLRAPSGTYAGPIVVGRRKRGQRAIVGVRAGAKLGSIKVGRGYAKPSKRLRKKWVDASRVARARKGVPIGARNFGRVRSRPPRGAIRGDRDLDGVPDPLDIDDDGDLILDNLDRSTAARAAQAVLDSPFLHSFLELRLTETVNANAGSSDEQIERNPFFGPVGVRSAALFIGLPPTASTELDCGRDDPATPHSEGLSYCRPGGSGTIPPRGPGQPAADFPECCDHDNDGFGTLVRAGHNSAVGMDLRHGATTTEMKTGQVLIRRINDANGVQTGDVFSHTLQYVFATVPALVSYSDTQGNTGTVSYPVAAGAVPPGPPGGPGTARNGFPVAAGPDGVVVTLTLWQPQRRPIPGEPGYSDPPSAWTDIGGLTYSADVESQTSGPIETKVCAQDAYSAPPGQPVTVAAPPAGPGLRHTLPDRPAHPDNKLTYTLNLTKCLGGITWNPGEEVAVNLRASGLRTQVGSEPGHASQHFVVFKLQQ